jgi:hypothetical protein
MPDQAEMWEPLKPRCVVAGKIPLFVYRHLLTTRWIPAWVGMTAGGLALRNYVMIQKTGPTVARSVAYEFVSCPQ